MRGYGRYKRIRDFVTSSRRASYPNESSKSHPLSPEPSESDMLRRAAEGGPPTEHAARC